jgi:hypothetical protein
VQFYFGPVLYNYSIHETVFSDFGDVPYSTPLMLPSWQGSPVVPRTPPFNWDYLGILDPKALIKSIKEHRVVLSPTYGLPDLNNQDEVTQNELWTDWLRDFVSHDEDPGEPTNDIYYPIVDSDLSTMRIVDIEDDQQSPRIVGLLVSFNNWL